MQELMMEKNSKIVIRLLLAINALCIIIICLLCGEIYPLKEQLAEVSDIVRELNDKLSKLETIQQEAINGGKSIEKGNGYLIGIAISIFGVFAVLCFGGIDPGDIGTSLNLLSEQSSKDIISQNVAINDNLKNCLRGVENINRNLLTEITTRTDQICAKLDVVINSMITKDMDLNSVLRKLTSGKSGWE